MRKRLTVAGALVVAAVTGVMVASVGSAIAATSQVVVPRGKPVQIAIVLDRSDSIGATYYAGVRNAIRMASQLTPAIDGFRIQFNDGFDAPCTGDTALAQGLADAQAVVANTQNVAVLGHFCSFGLIDATFAGPCPSATEASALSTYQSAGVVLINGSTTSPCLPAVGPTVFNATDVPDPGSDTWYAQITALPVDQLWQLLYRVEFGTAPSPFADTYFDATRLLLTRIQQTAHVVNGNLVIDRAALASAVRHTTNFPGVTCSVSLDPTTGFRVNDQAALNRCASPFFFGG